MLLAGVIIVSGAIVVTERVMAHRYNVRVQWGPGKAFELAPAVSPLPPQ
jgi:hypothetical protein